MTEQSFGTPSPSSAPDGVDVVDLTPPPTDDAALLRAYSESGDRQALNLLFARHADAAYRVALRCCRNSADAEDAVQSAFIEVLRHAAKFRGESAVKAWIFGFVVNACRHKAREEGRRAVREEKASVSGELAAEDRDLQEAVRSAVKGLPEHYRLPVWLHYCEGLSSPEVADALSLSENTVRSQLSRGVEELRSALATSGMALTPVALVGMLAGVADGVLGRAVLRRHLAGHRRPLLAGRAAAFLPRLVAGRVDHESKDPGSHGGFSPVLRRVAQHLDKSGLNRVLGIRGVAAAAKGHAVRRIGVPREEDVHRLPVTAFRERAEQSGVVGLSWNDIHGVGRLRSHPTREFPRALHHNAKFHSPLDSDRLFCRTSGAGRKVQRSPPQGAP